MMSEWFLIALEFRIRGYSMGELILTMALHFVALSDDAMRQVAAAYRCQIGREQ